ncbi:hypothetical protein HN51_015270, partial [Arachis hypogaea]
MSKNEKARPLLKCFSYEQIANATNEFHHDNLAGRDGYLEVYKGDLFLRKLFFIWRSGWCFGRLLGSGVIYRGVEVAATTQGACCPSSQAACHHRSTTQGACCGRVSLPKHHAGGVVTWQPCKKLTPPGGRGGGGSADFQGGLPCRRQSPLREATSRERALYKEPVDHCH